MLTQASNANLRRRIFRVAYIISIMLRVFYRALLNIKIEQCFIEEPLKKNLLLPTRKSLECATLSMPRYRESPRGLGERRR